jgi:hypothetical protein
MLLPVMERNICKKQIFPRKYLTSAKVVAKTKSRDLHNHMPD